MAKASSFNGKLLGVLLVANKLRSASDIGTKLERQHEIQIQIQIQGQRHFAAVRQSLSISDGYR